MLSGVANLLDSSSTNKANKEINQAQLDWQTKENDKSRLFAQREYDRQFEKQATYNSPTAQRARLEEAGYNPYLVNGQIAGSNTAPNISTPSDGARGATPTHPIQRSDFGFIGSAGRDAIQSYLNTKSVDANVANQSAKTDQDIINNSARIYELTGDKKQAESYMNRGLKANHGASYNMDNSPLARQLQAKANKDEADADYARTVADLKAFYGEKEIKAALRIQALSGNKLKEEMISLAKDRQKTDAEISKLISDKIRNYAETNHINADTQTINATRQVLVEGMKYDNKIKNEEYQIRSNEAGESNARFVQRRKARSYMVSPEGQDTEMHNQVTYDSDALNRLDRITEALNPFKFRSK